MDVSAATPARQLFSVTAPQAFEGRRDQLETDLGLEKVVQPPAPSDGAGVSAQGQGQPVAIDRTGIDEAEASPIEARRAETRFEADDRTNRLVYKVVDTSRGVVVQQLPTENALKLRAYLEQQSSDRAAVAEGDVPTVLRTA